MGFRRAAVRRLSFVDLEFAELEIDARLPTIREFQAASELLPLDPGDPARADETREFLTLLAELVERWNYENDDGAIRTIDVDAFYGMDRPMLLAVANAWVDSVIGVPAPLPQPSADGSPADELPMTPIGQAS